jgi:hypothetical protein
MTSTDSNINKLSPFLEGMAECFDLSRLFDDFILPAPQKGNPILNDWHAVGLDYHHSIKIIHEELNETPKNQRI